MLISTKRINTEKIRTYLKTNKESLGSFAKRCFMSTTTLQKVLKGDGEKIKLEKLLDISSAMNVTTASLLVD